MFTVIKKPLTPNILWDATNKCPLCKFTKGKLETNNVELVAKLKEMGYEVIGELDKTLDGESDPVTSPAPDSEDIAGDNSDEVIGELDKEDTKPKRRNRKATEK